MPQYLRPALLASVAALLTISGTMAAQTPTPSAAPPANQSRPHRPRPKPTNLQVLPKDFTGDQVVDVMHKFEGALGVECEYCHAKNPTPSPTTGHLDFASDANPMKDRARIMMRMSEDVNQHFLAELKDPPAEHQVSCGTCHRGNAKPTVFVPPPDEHQHGGPPPAGTPPAGPPPAGTPPQ